MFNHLPKLGRVVTRRTSAFVLSSSGQVLNKTTTKQQPLSHTWRTVPFAVQNTRTYSSSDNGREDDKEQRAFAFQIMNPFSWLKVKLNTTYIQLRIDKEFTLESFMFGASQAFKVLLKGLSSNDYKALEGLLTTEAMKWLKENYHGSDPDLDFTLHNDELIVRKPKNIDITELGTTNRVHVDALFAAVKVKEKPYMITGVLRFQRDYSGETESDWVICQILQLAVKEIGSFTI